MVNFIAFDIRAGGLTHDRLSEIAIVVVKDGVIWDKYFEKIKPPKNPLYEVDFKNQDEVTLKEAWKDIKPYFDDTNYAVAFNLSVHKSNLEKSLAHYGISLPDIEYVCAYNWAKNTITEIEFPNWDTITDALGINLYQSNEPHLSQAIAAAEIVIKLQKLTGESIEAYTNQKAARNKEGAIRFFRSALEPPNFGGLAFTYDIDMINFDGIATIVTGEFEKFPERDKLCALLADKGALIKSSVNSKTQTVVLGEGAGPSKVQKIKDLIDQGKSITLINESTLYKYLNL